MSSLQKPAINNIIPKDISDIDGLTHSTQKSKDNILNILGLKIEPGFANKFKKYIRNIFHTQKINI